MYMIHCKVIQPRTGEVIKTRFGPIPRHEVLTMVKRLISKRNVIEAIARRIEEKTNDQD